MNGADGVSHAGDEFVTWRQLEREMIHLREVREIRAAALQQAFDLKASQVAVEADRRARFMVWIAGLIMTIILATIQIVFRK